MVEVHQDTSMRLLPQERDGKCRFDGPFVATSTALARFGDGVIVSALELVKNNVSAKGGLDHFQVLDVGGQRLWVIDDVEVVTALLPDDY